MNSEQDDPDYILDLSSAAVPPPSPLNPDQNTSAPAPSEARNSRPFLGVFFKCCGIYGKIYKTADAQAYAGHCPKCAKPARVKIGPGGTATRFFTAE